MQMTMTLAPARGVDPDQVLKLRDRGAVVVDVRSGEEFIGWPAGPGLRGGHIPGAIHLPRDRLRSRAYLTGNGIRPTTSLIVAGGRVDEVRRGASLLRKAGFQDVMYLTSSMGAWAADPSRPLARLPRYRQLVSARWLRELIDGRSPHAAPEGDWLVTEVSQGGPAAGYDKGHIPGAIHVDTDLIEADATRSPRNWWKLVPDVELGRRLRSLGIRRDTTVIVHGRQSIAAARFAWALLYAGVEDVRILDGGLRAWMRAGGEVDTRRRAPHSVLSFGGEIPGRPELKATCASVRQVLGDPAWVIADTRTWEEYLGRRAGYEEIPTTGRIAGARWAHAGSDVQSMEDYEVAPDGTFRSYLEVEGFWRDWDICRDRGVIFYCGTGWRASLAFFHAWLMGWPRIQLFDSGWMEWSMGPDSALHPVEHGEPSKVIEELRGATGSASRTSVPARGRAPRTGAR